MKSVVILMLAILLFCSSAFAAEVYMQSQTKGEFNGWEGNTIIELMNGTKWQQIDGRYLYYYYYSPMVTIYLHEGYFFASIYETDPVQVRQIR